ncbi:unnamed protein product [Microthlaspi erraticum]|uniref:Uncharacterized protein n=1 Tax=Microthlaspi erraticum TaxID=1685480 RepID=A0A6D2HPJ4_9BRAS|nr:unnamed protein product [Microthlaspi erraticum]
MLTLSEKGSAYCSGKLKKRGERSVLENSANPVNSVTGEEAQPRSNRNQKSLADEESAGGKRAKFIGRQSRARERGSRAPISGKEPPVKEVHSEIGAEQQSEKEEADLGSVHGRKN